MVTKDHDSVVHVHYLQLEENIQLGSDGDLRVSTRIFLVETKDNSIGEENRCSRSDYNRLETLCLSD
jgi:hypothetical protein